MTGGYLQSARLPVAAGTGVVGEGEGGAGEGGDRQILGSLASKENTKHQVSCAIFVGKISNVKFNS